MQDEMPTPYPVWPKEGFNRWLLQQKCGLCRMCEDGDHAECLDSSEEWNECDCATKGHVAAVPVLPPKSDIVR